MSSQYSTYKKCVSFIFLKQSDGKILPNGTGFLIGIKKDDSENLYNLYFVTAKHVLQKDGKFYDSVFIRFNKRDGNSDQIEVQLNNKNLALLEHNDKDVDLIAFAIGIDNKQYDFSFIPDNQILSKETVSDKIFEGDDVFFTGLFTSHIGQRKNQPILRFGKVALISDEKVEWKPSKFLDLYLMECNSFGGNSGSPVFFSFSPTRKPGTLVLGPPKIFLAGIMMGSFNNISPLTIIKSENSQVFSKENVGIAAITPAYKILEAIKK